MQTPQELTGHALVVEDDAAVRQNLAHALRNAGYPVATAANGREALQLVHAGGPPLVILLDLLMPVMDGWEFLVALRDDARMDSIPVVVLTAVSDEYRRENPLKAVAYMPKPIDTGRLLDAVRSAVAARAA